MTPKDQLLVSNDEFRKLAQEHTQYAERLESLTQKRYLTEDEKLEEVRLKDNDDAAKAACADFTAATP